MLTGKKIGAIIFILFIALGSFFVQVPKASADLMSPGIHDQMLEEAHQNELKRLGTESDAEYKRVLDQTGDKAAAQKAKDDYWNARIGAIEATYNKGKASIEAEKKGQMLPPDQAPEQIYCFQWSSPMFNWPGCAAIVGNWMLSLAAFVLWACALLFDFTLSYTLNFKSFVESLKVIDIGWGIFRDISNIFFIFLLLTAALGTIVNSGKYNAKAMIPSILIAALLINFSLFFTKVIIDASNITALQFYSHMGGTTTTSIPTIDSSKADATGIAAIFLQSMDLESLYTISTTKAGNDGSGGATNSAGPGVNLSAKNIALVGIGGTVLFLVTSFVLLAAIFLFIARTLILILLMTTAPIAYMASAFPGGPIKSISKDWWETFWKQILFAPIYMALMYISVVAVKALGGSSKIPGGFASMFNGDASSINIIFTFIMIIGFMVIALVSAVKFGAMGATTAQGMLKSTGNGIKNWAIRNTAGSAVGNLGYRYANSRLGTALASNRVTGALGGAAALRGAAGMTNLKIGGKSYQERIKEEKKTIDTTKKLIENREIKRRPWDTDVDYARKVKEQGAANKKRAGNYIGVDKEGNTSGILGFTLAKRTAAHQIQQEARKKLMTKGKKDKAKENLEKWVGKNEGTDSGFHEDFDNPIAGTELHEIRKDIERVNKALKTEKDKDIADGLKKELNAFKSKETKMRDKAEKALEMLSTEEEEGFTKLEKAIRESSSKDK